MSYQLAVIGTILGIAGLLIYLGKSLDEDHGAIKLLFYSFSLILMLAGINTAIEIATAVGAAQDIIDSLSSIYSPMLLITVFIIGYFIIYFIWLMFKSIDIVRWKRK